MNPRGENLPADTDLTFHAPDQLCATRASWDESCHRTPVLRDQDTFGIQIVEQGEAMLLEG